MSAAAWNAMKPPPGYIPGAGRGAVGFMTRSDIGPARVAPELGGQSATPGVVLGAGRGVAASTGAAALRAMGSSGTVPGAGRAGAGAAAAAPAKEKEKEKDDAPEGNYDSFAGYSERLFSDAPYDADDAEADRVYASVDARMDQRNKRRREAREDEVRRQQRLTQSRIGDAFVDVKRELAAVSEAEWEAIPDIGDRSLRYKQARKDDKYTPVPDSVMTGGLGLSSTVSATGGMSASIDPSAAVGGAGAGAGAGSSGSSSVAPGGGAASGLADIKGFSEARGQMLSLRLDRLSDSISGQTVVDPTGYLTSLSSQPVPTATADVADIKKARALMRSITTTNPGHGPGWIAAARLEEQVLNLPAARKLIREGCERCPEDEDVWLEAARLQPPAAARGVLAEAVRHLPKSVKVWMAAADLETDADAKRAVLRKALTLIPSSERLWKAAVALEPPEDARIMLARGVECVPTSVDMWLALARLETHTNAQRVLNQARLALPADPAIWVAAAKLEEAHLPPAPAVAPAAVSSSDGGAGAGAGASAVPAAASPAPTIVEKIVSRALKSLTAAQAGVDRETWLRLAEEAERTAAPRTAAAIVAATADVGVEEADRRRTWLADAEALEGKGAVACARAMYARLLEAFPDKEGVWLRAVALEKRARTAAASSSPSAAAGSAGAGAGAGAGSGSSASSSAAGAAPAVDALLSRAVAAVPSSEVLWLMHAKERWLGGDVPGARAVLRSAFAANPRSEAVWLAAAKLEVETGEVERARALLARARGSAPSARVIMKSALLERDAGDVAAEEALLRAGVAAFPTAPKLWIMLGQLYQRVAATRIAALAALAAGSASASSAAAAPGLLALPAPALAEASAFIERAREAYSTGTRTCPGSIPLWLLAARLEELYGGGTEAAVAAAAGRGAAAAAADAAADSAGSGAGAAGGGAGVARARALLETARLRIPRCPELYLQSVRLERRAGNERLAEHLLARGLQECGAGGGGAAAAAGDAAGGAGAGAGSGAPVAAGAASGIGRLWAEDILTAPRAAQKRKSVEALKRCDNDAHVVLAVAVLFWGDRKLDKARKWLHRATALAPDLGDAWVHALAFELQHGNAESQGEVERRCAAADPAHGERWIAVSKSPAGRRMSKLEVLRAAVAQLRAEQAASGLGGRAAVAAAAAAVTAPTIAAAVDAAAGSAAPVAPAPAAGSASSAAGSAAGGLPASVASAGSR